METVGEILCRLDSESSALTAAPMHWKWAISARNRIIWQVHHAHATGANHIGLYCRLHLSLVHVYYSVLELLFLTNQNIPFGLLTSSDLRRRICFNQRSAPCPNAFANRPLANLNLILDRIAFCDDHNLL